jgi:hypothetical protein
MVKTGVSELLSVVYVSSQVPRLMRLQCVLCLCSLWSCYELDGVSFTTGTIWNVNCTRVCFKPRGTVAGGFRMRFKVHYIVDPLAICLPACIRVATVQAHHKTLRKGVCFVLMTYCVYMSYIYRIYCGCNGHWRTVDEVGRGTIGPQRKRRQVQGGEVEVG